ncbi:hypothetical protein LMB85_09215, partial [Limosilactobacillus reuteri]|nr:hypothetical protein [Limosilactobacillus reuteri]MCC4493799.1 hypothetical protein [Limosilactobacillus reuteri]
RFGSLNMIPDVTPNGVFYLPPTGWLTSFYNPPFCLFKKIIYIEKGCMNLHREISETIDLLDFIVELLCANLLVFN